MDINNYLDFYDIFFNELMGDIFLGIIIGLIIVWFLSSKFKMPYQLSILFGLLWMMIVFAANTGYTIIWVFVVLIVGAMFYYAVNKLISR